MNPRTSEVLIILHEADAERIVEQLDSRLRILQRLPPRILVVAGIPGTIADVTAIPGVDAVLSPSAPPTTLPELSAAERLFIGAWRQRSEPKERPGDGLSWDAPAFTPPR